MSTPACLLCSIQNSEEEMPIKEASTQITLVVTNTLTGSYAPPLLCSLDYFKLQSEQESPHSLSILE